MVQLERILKLVSFGGVVLGLAVGASRLILSGGESGSVDHFALYVLSQTWLELVLVASLYVGAVAIRKVIPAIRREFGPAFRVEEIVTKYPVQIVLWMVLAVMLIAPAFFFVRARTVFWRDLVRRSYVETYKLRIDQLAAAGKVQDALNLTERVAANLEDDAEAYYVTDRLLTLRIAVERSAQLTKQVSGSWNPVTQREEFFQLVEAVALNPQNYIAADRVRNMWGTVETYSAQDVRQICANTSLADFSGWTRSLLEAKVHVAESESPGECISRADLIRESWRSTGVSCVLRLSDSTRAGASPAPRCADSPTSSWSWASGSNPAELDNTGNEQQEDAYWPEFPSPLDVGRAIFR